jgi:hypothetical protein
MEHIFVYEDFVKAAENYLNTITEINKQLDIFKKSHSELPVPPLYINCQDDYNRFVFKISQHTQDVKLIKSRIKALYDIVSST